MRRLATTLVVLLLVFGFGLMPAAASGSDDDTSGSGSASSAADDSEDSDDDDDADDDADEVDDDADEVDEVDEVDEDDDADDDGRHRRRHRRRHRNRGGDDNAGGATGGGGGGTTGGAAGGDGAAPGGGGALPATVEISDRAFTPATITVATGGTVTWKNVSREHTVTAGNGSFDSGVIDAGQQFSHAFTKPGTVEYLCLIHTEMKGTVVVGDGTKTATATGSSSSAAPQATRSASGATAGVAGTAGNSSLPSLRTVQPPLTAAAASTADVDVTEFAFVPEDVTIAPGGTVRWHLVGEAPHTVTSDSFDSGMLKPGDTFEQTFNDVGTVDYLCEFHPEMKATITIAEGAAPPGDAGGDPGAGGGVAVDDRDGLDTGGGAVAGTSTPAGALANTGVRGLPALLAGLAIILAGWAALVTGRRRTARVRRPT